MGSSVLAGVGVTRVARAEVGVIVALVLIAGGSSLAVAPAASAAVVVQPSRGQPTTVFRVRAPACGDEDVIGAGCDVTLTGPGRCRHLESKMTRATLRASKRLCAFASALAHAVACGS